MIGYSWALKNGWKLRLALILWNSGFSGLVFVCRVKTNEARGFVSRFPVFWTGADVFMAFYGHGDAGAGGHQAGSQGMLGSQLPRNPGDKMRNSSPAYLTPPTSRLKHNFSCFQWKCFCSSPAWQPPPWPPPSSLRECPSWTTASLSWCKTGCPTLVLPRYVWGTAGTTLKDYF